VLFELLGLSFNTYTAFLLWIIVNCLDSHSTLFFLKYGGKEGNLIFEFLFRKIGAVRTLMFIKMPAVLIVGELVVQKDGPNTAIMSWNIVFAYIAIRNYIYGFQLKNNPP